jgi:hypothetical protein
MTNNLIIRLIHDFCGNVRGVTCPEIFGPSIS